jgi:histidyl-tRNA synthetase
MNDPRKSLDAPLWQRVEDRIHRVAFRYGYHEIRLPILESAGLYAASGGEPQSFTAEGIALRPDGTPGCVKAVIEARGDGRLDTERLWYQGPVFRRQGASIRQIHQFGVEAFGMAGADIDAELIMMTWDIFAALGLHGKFDLEIHTVGTWQEQRASSGRLSADSRRHFSTLCALLDLTGVPYEANPTGHTGSGYYTRTVFCWRPAGRPDAPALVSGGRYDDLAAHHAGRPLPATGFAFDFDALVQYVARVGGFETVAGGPRIVIDLQRPQQGEDAVLLAHRLRRRLPTVTVLTALSGQEAPAAAEGAQWRITLRADQRVDIYSLLQDRTWCVPIDQVIDVVTERSRED